MFFNSVLVAGLALVAFSCGQVSNDFDVAQLDAASAAPASKEFQMELKSDLNPGYGNAVYFAGTFSGNWQKAYRGTYSEEKGWTLTVYADKAFEWKALTGSYDLGAVVSKSFMNLTYVAPTTITGSNPVPQYYKEVPYGKALFFVGDTNDSVAYRGTCLADNATWKLVGNPYNNSNAYSLRYDVYIGDWDLGEVVYNGFDGLTWAEGDNNTAEPDQTVTRRALLLSKIDNGAVCYGSINAMTSAFQALTFDGQHMETVEAYTDLTLAEIEDKFATIFKDTDDNDVSYIYINCHGSSEGWLALPTDGWWNGPIVRTMLDKYVRGEVVFIIDSCHSGNIIGRSVEEDTFAKEFISSFKSSNSRSSELTSERFHVLCSSSKTEYSWTWTNYIGFATSRWAKGLGWDYDAKEAVTMEADSDSDNKVTLEELYNYSSTRIPDNKQTIVVYPDNDNFVVGGRY